MQQSNAVAYCSSFPNNTAAVNTNPAAPPAAQESSNKALPQAPVAAQGASYCSTFIPHCLALLGQQARRQQGCLHICRLPPELLEML